jgi:polysaccharide deacetylase family protein (PEP-CTERM system associated)
MTSANLAVERRPIVNALTVDVEDYFQVSAFESHVSRADWEQQPRRVESNVERILELLDEHGARATFFTLGWIAERHPAMVRSIAERGHEIASHGYSHRRASEQKPDEFFADVLRAKEILEGVIGNCVRGYRAPSFSIGPRNAWAFDCIARAGYRYSSSLYPIHHDHYGAPGAPRFAHETRPGLLELPVATVRVWNTNLPAGGGGYFRLLPYKVSRWSLERIHRLDGKPAMFYFHPWEIDPGQPRFNGVPAKTRFRHYVNLERTQARLSRLLRDFRWDRADRVFLDHPANETRDASRVG